MNIKITLQDSLLILPYKKFKERLKSDRTKDIAREKTEIFEDLRRIDVNWEI